jgi:hypothetical protein
MSVKMRTTRAWTVRPYEALLNPEITKVILLAQHKWVTLNVFLWENWSQQ